MKKSWAKAVLAAAALTCMGAANAYVINFENIDTTFAPFAPLLVDGDAVTQGNYFVNTQDVANGGGLVGQLSLGSDPTSCLDGTCPTGNSSNFLSVYDDGLVHVGNLNGGAISFASASVAFLKASGDVVGTTGMFMAVEADANDANGNSLGFFVAAVPVTGSGSFASVATVAGGTNLSGGQVLGSDGGITSFNDSRITDLFFYAYYCDPTGPCSAFKTNKGQFAIDNITVDVAAVPEPSQWLLSLAGLAAVGAVVRRRRAA